MGLAITKKIIENLDGKIWVESNVDLGSKFYFYIVVEKGTDNTVESAKYNDYEEKAKELLVENEKIQQYIPQQNNVNKDVDISNLKDEEDKKVLLVEDNEINQEITKK